MHARVRPSLYQQLECLPDGLIGEILDGQLHTQPRPTGPHAYAASMLGADLAHPFDKGRGGPGGWWIIDEPELHFLVDVEVDVPDIAGWRRERMPSLPDGHRFTVVPDWICEVLSPSTESKDREIKMPIYARFGVAHAWLVDPRKRTLETFDLIEGAWQETGRYSDQDAVRAVPFDAVSLALGDLWAQ
jgi:Uma2 family endonuclease